MAIVTFWSPEKDKVNQTASIIASALEMGIERNLKILLIDMACGSDTMQKAFTKKEKKRSGFFSKPVQEGLNAASGTDALITAATSNKVAPEIVKSYTVPILKDRLDILYGIRSQDRQTFENALTDFIRVLEIADKYYDIVYVDLEKGELTENIKRILKMSDLIVYPFEQQMDQIEKFETLWGKDELFSPKQKVIPLLTKEDAFSKYNSDNIARKIGMKPGMCSIIYNTLYMEAMQEGTIINLFFTLNNDEASYRNNYFLKTILDLNMLIIDRLQQFNF